MLDIVALAARAQAEVAAINQRLNAACAEFSDTVDMTLLGEVLDDLAAARFTAGDIAAVYSYRLSKRRRDG